MERFPKKQKNAEFPLEIFVRTATNYFWSQRSGCLSPSERSNYQYSITPFAEATSSALYQPAICGGDMKLATPAGDGGFRQ